MQRPAPVRACGFQLEQARVALEAHGEQLLPVERLVQLGGEVANEQGIVTDGF